MRIRYTDVRVNFVNEHGAVLGEICLDKVTERELATVSRDKTGSGRLILRNYKSQKRRSRLSLKNRHVPFQIERIGVNCVVTQLWVSYNF